MSINGIAEAYYYAVTPSNGIRRGVFGQLCASIAMLCIAIMTKDYIGTNSLILANCIACIIRIYTTLCGSTCVVLIDGSKSVWMRNQDDNEGSIKKTRKRRKGRNEEVSIEDKIHSTTHLR